MAENTKQNSYLTFKLENETFAANVSKVLNILELSKITKVPKAPEYMKGVINLRGSVLPLIDTRIKFGMSETEFTTNTCILVLDIEMEGESVHVGALVDSVQEVIELTENEIKPPPSIGNKYKSEFIDGMARLNDEFVMILNMDYIFSVTDIIDLQEATTIAKESSNVEEVED
jgi:purine-binding chemotaxis protein CheW